MFSSVSVGMRGANRMPKVPLAMDPFAAEASPPVPAVVTLLTLLLLAVVPVAVPFAAISRRRQSASRTLLRCATSACASA